MASSGRLTANGTPETLPNGERSNKPQWYARTIVRLTFIRPPSLKTFVQRCYEHVVNNDSRIDIELAMKEVYPCPMCISGANFKIITQKAQDGTLWTTDWDAMPIPTPSPPRPMVELPPKRPISRFDVEPVSISLNKRLKTELSTIPSTMTNPLSESDSDSAVEHPQPQKKTQSAFQGYGDAINKTKEELQRRDHRIQRFSEAEARATPPRVDTPDYVRDAQIAASLVNYCLHCDVNGSHLRYLMTDP
jgi:hypothetical protein